MDIGWKVASTVAVIGAGILAERTVDLGWKVATGKTPPRGDEEAVATILEVALFGAISGLLVTIFRRAALKGTNKWYGGRTKNVLEKVQR
ncbi:MAG: DUF4235 domain-containing protein [Actinomycetaceae bacterium]|nr:DUF4235 domain-containing protein [Actinomycetaceae bacterium]